MSRFASRDPSGVITGLRLRTFWSGVTALVAQSEGRDLIRGKGEGVLGLEGVALHAVSPSHREDTLSGQKRRGGERLVRPTEHG